MKRKKLINVEFYDKIIKVNKMVNILLCGNEKVFDGALTQLISMTNRTQETIRCYIFTMNLTRMKPEYKSISDSQVKFLEKVIKEKNSDNEVIKVDVTDLYEKEFKNCANEGAYCTPYTLLRLLADKIPNIPDKLLYLDIDIMIITGDCCQNGNSLFCDTLVQRILSNRHIDLPDFSYAALSSIAVATATPHSSALHMRKSSYVNITDT